ncbi:ABC-type transport auxiliary lipoprotein family protein [Pseudomonas rubra]|uniref:ABC-type transport auxiliary lipoprotein family protein n=1 Tax=Pseudomonas rubra TaxID=2942627 RepID=A0ABT5PB73_9PSED|nr:ABC-type transport auxiliary lipoprotein family protein [Pseudomonas rubra]MDD1015549.1 ABC-type transport auxiliary lipoprotein family protein [Pseudomonas rubra]MDD1038827.1 ABC-type transport auxiliary lipoprotein family protein [Pseudomonas rubra]MDD1153714.1 ABC-type transport auxiliary lipoprotein family protein [Pseudomonas rubra]
MKRTCRYLALAAALSLGSACSILPQAEPADVYRLPSAQITRSVTQSNPWSLRINKPIASDALSSPRIAVVPQGNLISSYKGARWSDPTPTLLRNRMLDAFQRDGRVQHLSADDSNLQSDYEIAGELQAFQSEYSADGLAVVIRYDARLVQGRTQRIVASQRFEVRQPLGDKQVAAVVSGFGAASDQLMNQLVDWTVSQATLLQAKNQ